MTKCRGCGTWNPHWIGQLIWKLLQLVSILSFSQSLEIVGYDFENILQTQKFAMTEPTKCETSHTNEEQVNKGGLIYAKSSMSKLKYCMYRAAYRVTVLKKSSWYDDATYLNKKSQIIRTFYPIKESVCRNLWQGHKARLPRLVILNSMLPKKSSTRWMLTEPTQSLFRRYQKLSWKAEMRNEWIMSTPWIGSIQWWNTEK